MIDKIGPFYLPTKICFIMRKLGHFVGQQNSPILLAKIEHVLSLTILLADFVYRSTKFGYVTMVIVYNGR